MTLFDGEVKTGEILALTPESITLGKVGNYGFEEAVIPVSSIAKIEVEPASSTGSRILGVVGSVRLL